MCQVTTCIKHQGLNITASNFEGPSNVAKGWVPIECLREGKWQVSTKICCLKKVLDEVLGVAHNALEVIFDEVMEYDLIALKAVFNDVLGDTFCSILLSGIHLAC